MQIWIFFTLQIFLAHLGVTLFDVLLVRGRHSVVCFEDATRCVSVFCSMCEVYLILLYFPSHKGVYKGV